MSNRQRAAIQDVLAYFKNAQASPAGWSDPTFSPGGGGLGAPSGGSSGGGGSLPWWANQPHTSPTSGAGNPNEPPALGWGDSSGGGGAGGRPGRGRDAGTGAQDPGGDPTGDARSPGSYEMTSGQAGRAVGGLWDMFAGFGGGRIGSAFGDWASQYQQPNAGTTYGQPEQPAGWGAPGTTQYGYNTGSPGNPVRTTPDVTVHYGDTPSNYREVGDAGGYGNTYFGPSRGGGGGAAWGDNYLNDTGRSQGNYWDTVNPDARAGGSNNFGSTWNNGIWGGGGGGGQSLWGDVNGSPYYY